MTTIMMIMTLMPNVILQTDKKYNMTTTKMITTMMPIDLLQHKTLWCYNLKISEGPKRRRTYL
jgi:hypothetical protein